MGGAINGRSEAFFHGIQIGLVAGVLNTTVTILSPLVEWWADNLPDRALGGYRAFLLLICSVDFAFANRPVSVRFFNRDLK